MTNTELKAQIDLQITNETAANAITPNDVGANMKAVVDYVDQEIVANAGGLPFKTLAYALGFVTDGSVNDAIIYNNLALEPTINNPALGVYEVRPTDNPFTSNKTFMSPFGYQGTTTDSGVIRLPIFSNNIIVGYWWAQRISTGIIKINFTDTAGAFVNPYTILNTRIVQLEIKVYN